MVTKPEEKTEENVKPDPDEDLENCKGQCGYTPWCKNCEKTLMLQRGDISSPSFSPAGEEDSALE